MTSSRWAGQPDGRRILAREHLRKLMSADEAAALIRLGADVGMSGFTGEGHPKVVPGALARPIAEANTRGDPFAISVWSRASTAPEIDGALAAVDGIESRMP